jgi:hypothetical protein
VFLHLVRSTGHIVWSGRLRHEMWMHNFSCSGTPRADPAKKCAGTRYAKLVFLHLMESVGHAIGKEFLFTLAPWAKIVPRPSSRSRHDLLGLASTEAWGLVAHCLLRELGRGTISAHGASVNKNSFPIPVSIKSVWGLVAHCRTIRPDAAVAAWASP